MPSQMRARPDPERSAAAVAKKTAPMLRCAFAALTIVAFVLLQPAIAQYRLDSFTTENGLPQNGVRDLVQTPDGYLWFTTFDGLVRFDGLKFVVFDKNNSPGIQSNRFFLLHVEPDGRLLAGTEDGGLTVYSNGSFRTFTSADGLPSNNIIDFARDVDGNFYVWTAEGLSYFRDERFSPVPDDKIPNNTRFYRGPSGDVYFYETNGIRQFSAGIEKHFYEIPIRAYNEKFTGVRVFEDRRGYAWFGDLNGVYRLKDGEITKFTAEHGVPRDVCLRPYLDDADGAIWFTSGMPWIAGVGLVHFKDGRFSVLGRDAGLSSLLIHRIDRDSEGNIWVSTADRGLNRLREQIVKSLSIADGLPAAEVYPILQGRGGEIYVGTTRGLSVYRGGRFEKLLLTDTNGQDVSITALYEEDNGVLWVGSANGTFFRRENGQWKRYLTGTDAIVWCIHKDRAGIVRLGTDQGVYEVRDGTITADYTSAQRLPTGDTKTIFQDRSGTLWFGTYGGLIKYENCNGPLAGCTKQVVTAAEGLASDRVRSIFEDDAGVLWFGTYDGGISRFADGRFFNFTIENGLFNNGAFQILEDGQRNFWISCNKGIYRISRQELDDFAAGRISRINSTAYGKSDGMFNAEANGGRQPAGIRAADGKLWFPTQDGVAIVNPAEVKINSKAPPVQIEAVLVDRVSLPFANGVSLDANRNNLEIRYTGISFVKPELMKFRYRLEGLNNEWTDVRNIREVYFPSLPPGEFTFHIIAANSDGVWNEEGARLAIRVNAPFWKKTWFLALAAFTTVLVIVTVFRLRERELRRREREQQEFSRRILESQEGERKRIASEMHDSLGQYLLAIKNWALFGLNSIPEKDAAREYLREVSETSSIAIDEVREIAHNLRPYQLERLGLTNTLEYMFKNFSASSPIAMEYEIDKIDGFFSKDDEIVFYRIVQESLNNVIKHSEAKHAKLSITLRNNVLKFRCEDDGRGFEPAAARISADSGLGLNGIAERVKILQGNFRIDSEKGRGTILVVTVGKDGAR